MLKSSLLLLTLAIGLSAQDKAPAPATAPTPGPRVTELSPNTRTFQLVFPKGTEVGAALLEFADKYNIRNAHFTAIGAFGDVLLGWYDPEKRGYKQNPLHEEMEIASFSGNITRDRNNKAAFHAHCVLGLNDGTARAGHFIEGHISLTMQMYVVDAGPAAATQSASR